MEHILGDVYVDAYYKDEHHSHSGLNFVQFNDDGFAFAEDETKIRKMIDEVMCDRVLPWDKIIVSLNYNDVITHNNETIKLWEFNRN